MAPSSEFNALVEYRMRSVFIGKLALCKAMKWDEVPSMEIRFSDTVVFEGHATGFTNSAIEAAIIHSRALLEFLGLKIKPESQTALRQLTQRNPDDHRVEWYVAAGRLTIEEACKYYPGDPVEAEAALAYVIHLANKGLAHTSSTFTVNDDGTHLLLIAFGGIPELVCNRFYVARGVHPPDYKAPFRTRQASRALWDCG